METLIIILAFWFILLGVWGALPLLRAPRMKAPAAPKFVQTPLTDYIEREVASPRTTTGEPKPVRGQSTAAPIVPTFIQAPSPAPQAAPAPVARVARQAQPRTPAQRTNPLAMFSADPIGGDPFAEVSMLRAQVEHLRHELVTRTTSTPASNEVEDKATRTRRYKVGAYAELPRPLRRQVREVREVRKPERISRAS